MEVPVKDPKLDRGGQQKPTRLPYLNLLKCSSLASNAYAVRIFEEIPYSEDAEPPGRVLRAQRGPQNDSQRYNLSGLPSSCATLKWS